MQKGTKAKKHSKIPHFGKLAVKLTAGLLCLFFFLGYQPVFAWPPVKKISPVKAQNSIEQTQEVHGQKAAVVFQLPHPGYISTYYSSFHPGIDVASGLGMPIKPIYKGIVKSAGYNFWGLGLMVEIDHQNGYKSIYAHMGKVYVRENQKVEEDTYLGEVGMTGNTSGPHTHLEIKFADHYINPQNILPEIRSIPLAQDFNSKSVKLTTPVKQVSPSAPPTLPIPPASSSAQLVQK